MSYVSEPNQSPMRPKPVITSSAQSRIPYRSQISRTPAPVALGRREAAAGVLDRLHDHHRDRVGALGGDRVLEVVEQERVNSASRLVRRAGGSGSCCGRARPSGTSGSNGARSAGDAVDRERAHRRPVVGDVARDRLPAPLAAGGVVLPRELPGRLDRLRAAGDEEDAVQVAGRELGHLGGELDRARVRVRPVRVEGQLAHLLVRGLADLVAVRVADVARRTGRRARRGSACRSCPRGSSRRRAR